MQQVFIEALQNDSRTDNQSKLALEEINCCQDETEKFEKLKLLLDNKAFQPKPYDLADFVIENKNQLAMVTLILDHSICSFVQINAILMKSMRIASAFEVTKLCMSHSKFLPTVGVDREVRRLCCISIEEDYRTLDERIDFVSLILESHCFGLDSFELEEIALTICSNFKKDRIEKIEEILLLIYQPPHRSLDVRRRAIEVFEFTAKHSLFELFNFFCSNKTLPLNCKINTLAIAKVANPDFEENFISYLAQKKSTTSLPIALLQFLLSFISDFRILPEISTIIFLFIYQTKRIEVCEHFYAQISPEQQIINTALRPIESYLGSWCGDYGRNRAHSFKQILNNENLSPGFKLFALHTLQTETNGKKLIEKVSDYVDPKAVETYARNYVTDQKNGLFNWDPNFNSSRYEKELVARLSELKENLLTIIHKRKVHGIDITFDLATASEAEFKKWICCKPSSGCVLQ